MGHIIDFHCHILPGIDDGSDCIDTTAKLLEMEKQQAVTDIVFTPHFYAHRMNINKFIENRDESYKKVISYIEKKAETSEDIGYTKDNFHVGGEIYFFSGMSKAKDIKKLCIEGTDNILVEMPFEQWNKQVVSEINSLIYDCNLHVVIAHIERFVKYQKDKKYFNEIINLPVSIQLNGEAFLGSIFDKRFAIKFIDSRDNIILGSDCHNIRSRAANLGPAREVIAKKYGKQKLDSIDEYTKKILGI